MAHNPELSLKMVMSPVPSPLKSAAIDTILIDNRVNATTNNILFTLYLLALMGFGFL